jgi:hypothetical protein
LPSIEIDTSRPGGLGPAVIFVDRGASDWDR